MFIATHTFSNFDTVLNLFWTVIEKESRRPLNRYAIQFIKELQKNRWYNHEDAKGINKVLLDKMFNNFPNDYSAVWLLKNIPNLDEELTAYAKNKLLDLSIKETSPLEVVYKEFWEDELVYQICSRAMTSYENDTFSEDINNTVCQALEKIWDLDFQLKITEKLFTMGPIWIENRTATEIFVNFANRDWLSKEENDKLKATLSKPGISLTLFPEDVKSLREKLENYEAV